MQINIDGRFQAVVRKDDTCWTVYHAETNQLPQPDDVARFVEREANDIAAFFDMLMREAAGGDRE